MLLIILPVVGLMAFGSTVGVSLAVLLLSFLAGLLFFLPDILLAVLFDVAC
jgi:hypothetical protein